MSKSFLGVGVAFPVQLKDKKPVTASDQGRVDEQAPTGSDQDRVDKQVVTASDEESVRQSISIILGTSKGERVMRPDFGCGIYDLVFEVNSASTSGKIAHAVREALLQEPRIDVGAVQVEAQGSGETLLIQIEYRVRATNNVFNLVYPFYLDTSAR